MTPKTHILVLLAIVGVSLCNQYTIEVTENKFSVKHIYEQLGTLTQSVRSGKSIFEVENLNEAVSNKFLKVNKSIPSIDTYLI